MFIVQSNSRIYTIYYDAIVGDLEVVPQHTWGDKNEKVKKCRKTMRHQIINLAKENSNSMR